VTYGVGCLGLLSLFGAVGRGAVDAPHNDNVDVPYLGNAWHPTAIPNLGATAYGYTRAQVMDQFTNYTAAPRAAPAIGGNYKPLSTATYIKNRVPAGRGVLLRDIAGSLRKQDGTGAAGCYEAA